MNKLTSNEIRQAFLHYFQKHNHQIVPSSSLVPNNDETLLFTNAGMVQFKELFLGKESRSYKRAASVQKCVRAGGKHNDLENVGFTTRHHTFFEMLGNFSFGDYFKREAIQYAWDFLVNVLKLPPERLWITVHNQDKEAEKIWLNEIKVSEKRFARLGDADNFWAMGETGPCGYCSEIYYDHGEKINGGAPGSGKEGDRYVEIWNLVFMEFARDVAGTLTPLPHPSVDTGMGLERIASVLQGVHDNYQTDILAALIQTFARDIAEITTEVANKYMVALRIIADHIRTIAFLIADGVMPSNERRGYVLRRIIRRAERHLRKIPLKPKHEAYLYQLITKLCELMGEAYPELIRTRDLIEKVVAREEIMFRETLDRGLKLFTDALTKLKGTIFPGEIAFQLYDTFGFPIDLTVEMAKERSLMVDMTVFNRCMEEQQARSRDAGKFADAQALKTLAAKFPNTIFVGYEKLQCKSKVLGIIKNQEEVKYLSPQDHGIIILTETPFYAEAGGQVGDQGEIKTSSGCFLVKDTKKQGNVYLHYGEITAGVISVEEQVSAYVNHERLQIAANHTAAHLLQAALRKVLGTHVAQRGSYVDAVRLRFDFAHFEALTQAQLDEVEKIVNNAIAHNLIVTITEMTLAQAEERGAIALFDEKYGEKVRVVDVNGESMELCGGTHVHNTGAIGIFKIVAESSIAAGIRRIEAVTGTRVIGWFLKREQDFKAENEAMLDRETLLKQEINQLKNQLAIFRVKEFLTKFVDIKGVKVLIAEMSIDDIKQLRNMIDLLKERCDKAVILMGAIVNNKVQLVAGTKNVSLSAAALVKHVVTKYNGSGGGKPDMAQGGFPDANVFTNALQEAKNWIDANILD